MTGKRVFRTTDELVAWMHDEYLSEITLDDVEPTPGGDAAPADVRFTWSLHGTGNGAVVPYRVRATGVRRWTLDGEHGTQAIGMAPVDGAGVAIAMETPGTFVLVCDALEVTRGRARKARGKARGKARPHTDYMYFVAEGPRVVSAADVARALGPPMRATVDVEGGTRGEFSVVSVKVDGVEWVRVVNMHHETSPGFHLSVARKGASDEDWHVAQELPQVLGAARVSSAWEFEGTTADWLRAIGKAGPKGRQPA